MPLYMILPIAVTWITLDQHSISLITAWQTEQLTYTVTPAWAEENNVTWSTSNPSIATVSSTWLVTCVTPGECVITVTTVDWWFTDTCNIVQEVEHIVMVNFDSNQEATDAWYVFQAIDYWWVTTSWWNLVVNANHNDSWWLIYRDINSYNKWKFQTRVYMQGTSWWWDQHVAVAWWDFTWNVRNSNWPAHYFSMTTSSWYTWGSWISDWTTWDPVYSWSWWFTWRYVYEISYDNWTYVLTRYNDTSEVTEESTYTHRKTFTWLWRAWNVGIFLRTWFTSENYIKADWAKLIYYE